MNMGYGNENASPNRGRVPAGPYDQGQDQLFNLTFQKGEFSKPVVLAELNSKTG